MRQRYILFFLILLCFAPNGLWGQKKITTPIAGKYGKDYIIVNHVDWGIGDSVKDAWCGSKSYNGHQGTDFTLRNFIQMDSGVNVLACDTGVVTFVKDGIFDKETESVISKGLGNYIAIAHSGKFYSYYGHLKKNSLLVKVGDTVLPGQVIAQVGSSGNSTDPHLHFEWWYDSSILIDPFLGPCGNGYSYWKDQIPYDTSFAVWNSGLTRDSLDLNKIRFQETRLDTFTTITDPIINYWSLLYGLKKGDSIEIEWYAPDNTLWFANKTTITQDYAYYYYWNFINSNSSFPSNEDWKVLLKRNSKIADQLDFKIKHYISLQWQILNNYKDLDMYFYFNGNGEPKLKVSLNNNKSIVQVLVYNSMGSEVWQQSTEDSKTYSLSILKKGFYFVVIKDLNNQLIEVKKILI